MNAKAGLIAIVGPSGVGKDSVIDGMLAKQPGLKRVKRTTTRARGLGGEDYHSMDEKSFMAAIVRGEFSLHWKAHGLYYGIPMQVLHDINNGCAYVANLSRGVLSEAVDRFSNVTIINLTAKTETLASRLARRGRESKEQIHARLERRDYALPAGLSIHTISNDGELAHTVDKVIEVINHSSIAANN